METRGEPALTRLEMRRQSLPRRSQKAKKNKTMVDTAAGDKKEPEGKGKTEAIELTKTQMQSDSRDLDFIAAAASSINSALHSKPIDW